MKLFSFTGDRARRAEEILRTAVHRRAALLPLLWLAQEQEGWVPREAVAKVARLADAAEAEVFEILSFHTMFRQSPPAHRRIEVCVGPCCQRSGADGILARLEKELGIGPGETRADGSVSLATVQCVGACDGAPAVRVNEELCPGFGDERVDDILRRIVG
jgi:NADH:ubiquinone oxidoreductase subunit E